MRGAAANGRARRPTHGLRRLAVCVRHNGVRSPTRRPVASGVTKRARENPRMVWNPQRFDIVCNRAARRVHHLRARRLP